jgi:chromatin remodeling complex protein RSC6
MYVYKYIYIHICSSSKRKALFTLTQPNNTAVGCTSQLRQVFSSNNETRQYGSQESVALRGFIFKLKEFLMKTGQLAIGAYTRDKRLPLIRITVKRI